ncbi:RNA polymerase-binding protein RbpA [Lentzea aerocolonigenes]|uniref:RNA polymerase-binding protein RbpA n=1 Tax=Lentzea aerocolonigenes TaxID=68170 RepID=UPI0022AB4602|nr:RNA polymerase-binding protein RbpA [Lentzea aerocolonigenes]
MSLPGAHRRTLLGRRPEQRGPQHYQGEVGPNELAFRVKVIYRCPKDHDFYVMLAADAESPARWECATHGVEADHAVAPQPEKWQKPPRTHWDMLIERRSIPELEELLNERLDALRASRSVAT